jgi:two-component system, cell cycle response regulator
MKREVVIMITKKIFNDLAIYMIGFGVIIGLFFPLFMLMVGIPSEYVLSPIFIILCVFAGFVVGLFNIFLSRQIVGRKLKQLSNHMKNIEKRLLNRQHETKAEQCLDENCYINIQSEDEIGQCGHAFNALVETLALAFQSESTVRTFTEVLASHLELSKLSDEALSSLMHSMHAAAGAILLEKDGDVEVISSLGILEPNVLLKSNHVWNVLKDQKRMHIEFPEDLVIENTLLTFKPKALLIEPIKYKDVTLGAIILASHLPYNEDLLSKMNMFSQGLSLAFRNAISHNRLQQLAAIDPLTNILNRRFGIDRLKEEFSRSIRNNAPLGVILFDIDHFKAINDTYGHIVGDKVLASLAKAVKTVLRDGDILFRYGGEEFIVLLPGAAVKDVIKAAEQIRHIAEDLEINYQEQVLKITISLGGVSYPEMNVTSFELLMSMADQKMYLAKERGRNQSVV